MEKKDLEKKYNTKFLALDFESITSAIPNIWKRKGKDINKDSITITPYVTIKVNNKNKKLIEVETKEIYWHMIENIGERATSEKDGRKRQN
jgi:hypothetical protein